MCIIKIVLTILCFRAVFCSVFYVAPSNDQPQCNTSYDYGGTAESCHSLEYYAKSQEIYFTDNTVFNFLPGKHYLNQTLLVTAVVNITLQGLGDVDVGFHDTVMQSNVIIDCSDGSSSTVGGAGIVFIDVIDLTLSKLTITQCNSIPLATGNAYAILFWEHLVNIGTVIEGLGLLNTSISMYQVLNAQLINLSIQNSTQVGLLAINVFNATIESSSFAINNLKSLDSGCDNAHHIETCYGGNVILAYTLSWPNLCYGLNFFFKFDITNSNFSFASSFYIDVQIPGGGLTVFIDNYSRYGVHVSLTEVYAHNNTAVPGGNINFVTTQSSTLFRFDIHETLSLFGNRVLQEIPQDSFINIGGGLLVLIGVTSPLQLNYIGNCSLNQLKPLDTIILLNNSQFTNNNGLLGGGAHISVKSFPISSIVHSIIILSCDFSNNFGYIGIGLYIDQVSFHTFATPLEYDIIDVTVSNSLVKIPKDVESKNGNAVYMTGLHRVNVFDISITNNTPVQGAYLSSSNLLVTGLNNVFSNNSALSGGALSILQGSLVTLVPPAVLKFVNNQATIEGGAIFVETGPTLSPYCFFQIQSDNVNISQSIVQWHFINNSAQVAGDSIYGENINKCLMINTLYTTNDSPLTPTEIFKNFFFFENRDNSSKSFSSVSSDPNKVCFCFGSSLNCSITETYYTAYPGTNIILSLATVGVFDSYSQGIINLETFANDNDDQRKVDSDSYIFIDEGMCANYYYPVKTNATELQLKLKVTPREVNVVDSLVSYPLIFIVIRLLPCPPGFSLNADLSSCVCNSALSQAVSNVSCNISSQLITRSGDTWIGYQNSSSCLFAQNKCPFDYCTSEQVSFSVYSPDAQCAIGRSGVSCGSCDKGLSLMLGSNKCGKCSDYYLALLLVFGVAGLLLILLLTALNLTVSEGVVNGLIYVANIIKIYETAFFTNGQIFILSQFISWINLDFGIQVCFYDGLDAIVKSWLQFIFPVYIWLLIILIIILCKFSSSFSRLIGHNILPVFATLILLSYTKLFRTVVPVIQFNRLECNITGEKVYFWSRDGNVPYTSTEHVVLLVFSLFVFCGLIIPFTAIVFAHTPFLTRINVKRFQTIFLRLKPVFDAYNGPYKKGISVIWTGVLLVARLILVITATVSSTEVYRSVVVGLTSVLLTILVAMNGVYTSRLNNIVEGSFLLTLTIVASFVQYSHYVTLVGVLLILIGFCAICISQFYLVCLKSRRWNVLFSVNRKKDDNVLKEVFEDSVLCDSSVAAVVGKTVIAINGEENVRTRESLIFSDDSSTIPYTELH